MQTRIDFTARFERKTTQQRRRVEKGGKIRKLERPGYEPRVGEVNQRSVN